MLESIVTVAVGAIALLVYYLSKRSEKRNAAIIIVMDIRHAEQVILGVLEKGAIDRFLPSILPENNWGKYKHLFAAYFSYDDFSAFDRFFNGCTEISEARNRLADAFLASISAKAQIAQQKVLEIPDVESEDGQKKRWETIQALEKEEYVFEPSEPSNRIFRSFQIMGKLSPTSAFEKLKKIGSIHS